MAPKGQKCDNRISPALRSLMTHVSGGSVLLTEWGSYIRMKKALQTTPDEGKHQSNEAAGARILREMEFIQKGYQAHDARAVVLAEQALAAAIAGAEADARRPVTPPRVTCAQARPHPSAWPDQEGRRVQAVPRKGRREQG